MTLMPQTPIKLDDLVDARALLDLVVSYKSEILAKVPAPERKTSYFHLPFDDARTSTTHAQRGSYSGLVTGRDTSRIVNVYKCV